MIAPKCQSPSCRFKNAIKIHPQLSELSCWQLLYLFSLFGLMQWQHTNIFMPMLTTALTGMQKICLHHPLSDSSLKVLDVDRDLKQHRNRMSCCQWGILPLENCTIIIGRLLPQLQNMLKYLYAAVVIPVPHPVSPENIQNISSTTSWVICEIPTWVSEHFLNCSIRPLCTITSSKSWQSFKWEEREQVN